MLVVALLPFLAQSGSKTEASEDRAVVVQAVFAQDRLWILDESGRVSSLAEGEEAPTSHPTPDPALDLIVHEGVPCVVTGKKDPSAIWRVLRREERGFEEVAEVAQADDLLLGLGSSPTGLVLVTSCRIVEIDGGSTREVWLSCPLVGGGVRRSTLADSASIHVGFDDGEYGGGLFRIDRRTGVVDEIHGVDPADVAVPLLDRDYSTVNGIVPLPWEPGTFAVSCAEYEGKVYAVRGDRVRILYQEDSEQEGLQESDVLCLASASGSVWGIGLPGMFRIDADGRVTKLPAPPTRKYGELEASFAFPGLVIIVRDDYGRQYWPFGTHPLLVAR